MWNSNLNQKDAVSFIRVLHYFVYNAPVNKQSNARPPRV